MKIKQSTVSFLALFLFFSAIAAAITYADMNPKLSCEERGGIITLIGYGKVHGGGEFLYAKYRCEGVIIK